MRSRVNLDGRSLFSRHHVDASARLLPKPMAKRENTVVVPKDTVVKNEAIPFLLHDGDFLRLTKLHWDSREGVNL